MEENKLTILYNLLLSISVFHKYFDSLFKLSVQNCDLYLANRRTLMNSQVYEFDKMKFLALTSKLIYKVVCAFMISYANSSQFPVEISSNMKVPACSTQFVAQ